MMCLLEAIGEANPDWKGVLEELENATTLSALIIVAWQLARMLAIGLVEEVLAKRTQAKTEWGNCPTCGQRLQSKGFKPRQIKSIIGVVKWERRVGRCPHKCAIGQVSPLDKELGLASNQKSDSGLQQAACLVALFVPYETTEMLMKQLTGLKVSAQTIWDWVQAAGERMMKNLAGELAALAAGKLPEAEALSADVAAQTLLMGADGVMVYSFTSSFELLTKNLT
jgi:hypothetical protein